MTTITCKNGVILHWDETIKVGDIITTYNKGYWELVAIEPRVGTTPLFHYKKSLKPDGTPTTGKAIEKCDASYCRKAQETIEIEIDKALKLLINLRALQERLKSI